MRCAAKGCVRLRKDALRREKDALRREKDALRRDKDDFSAHATDYGFLPNLGFPEPRRTRQRKALIPSRFTKTLKNKNYHTFGNTHNGSRSLQVWHGHILFRTEITTYSPSTGISPDTKSLKVAFKRCSTESTSKFASGIHAPHFEQTKLSNCTTSS